MGAWGYMPTDSDDFLDLWYSVELPFVASIATLCGVKWRAHFKRAGDYVKSVANTLRTERVAPRPRERQAHARWVRVGVVYRALCRGVALPREVVEVVAKDCDVIATDTEWASTWRSPRAFQTSVRVVRDRLRHLLAWDGTPVIYGWRGWPAKNATFRRSLERQRRRAQRSRRKKSRRVSRRRGKR